MVFVKNQDVQECKNLPEKITTEQIILEVQNQWIKTYPVDMKKALKHIATIKYGENSSKPLTDTDKEIICTGLSFWSDFQKGFIRSHKEKVSNEIRNIYLEIIQNDSSVNVRNKDSVMQYRTKLIEAIEKNTDRSLLQKLNDKLTVAIVISYFFDERGRWSTLRKTLVYPALGFSQDSFLDIPTIMRLLSEKFPLN